MSAGIKGMHMLLFHFSTIVIRAGITVGVQMISPWLTAFILFGFIPRNEIAGSYGDSIFEFWATSILFSIMAVLIYIPTHGV